MSTLLHYTRGVLLVLTLCVLSQCSSGSSNNGTSQKTSFSSAPAAPVLDWTPLFASPTIIAPSPVLPTGLTGNVLDFGAKCDGSTDDREAIQTALDTVVVLLFPVGATCVVNASSASIIFFGTLHQYALSIPSNRTLYLNGSILKLGDGQNAHLFINSNIVTLGNHDIAIIGPGTIDLNKYYQTNPNTGEQSGGFMDLVTKLTIRDIVFKNVREYALRHFRVTQGYYDNLVCTDSDGSCFAFGIAAIGGPNNCYFGNIEGHNAAGISSAGAQGNPFISYGSGNTLASFVGTGNRFGFKLQDGAADWTIGRIQVNGTTADKGAKIMGTQGGSQTRRVTIGEMLTSGNYYEGLYVWQSSDIEIRRFMSKGDSVSAASAALRIASTADGIAIKSISVQESKGAGISIEGGDVDIWDMYARNNGLQLAGQENVSILPTGRRIRIGSLITVDDQQAPTVVYGLGIHSGASDVNVQSFLPIGSFILGQIRNEGANVNIVDYQTVAKVFVDGDTTPSVVNGMLFRTANSHATVISNFEDGSINQEVSILCGDSYTTFSGTQGLQLAAPMNCTDGNLIRFIYDGTVWSETERTSM